MSSSKQLVNVGQVRLTLDQLTDEQKEAFGRAISVIDRNPVLDWSRDNHNLDFILVEGKIEPVKAFGLKCCFLFGLSTADIKTDVIGEGLSIKVVGTTEVWREGHPRRVVKVGASTAVECGAKKNKYGKRNKRAFHDAVRRAHTRALKNALEEWWGFAWINLVTLELFGGYGYADNEEVRRAAEGRTEEAEIAEAEVRATLDRMNKAGRLSPEEKDRWDRRVTANRADEGLLVSFARSLCKEEEARSCQ